MNPLHTTIVQKFRNGASIADLAKAFSCTPRHVHRVLSRSDVVKPRFAKNPHLIPQPKTTFQSRWDGEYAKCLYCEKRGYGEDSWLPATSEFWTEDHGRLSFSRCRACLSDMKFKVSGVVPERVAA